MIWRVSDVDESEKYRLHLCMTSNGLRFLRLAVIDSAADSAQSGVVIFSTNPVPNDILRGRNVGAIARQILLSNGQPFFVDAHGSWITESECKEMDAGVDFREIKWATGQVPRFAPR